MTLVEVTHVDIRNDSNEYVIQGRTTNGVSDQISSVILRVARSNSAFVRRPGECFRSLEDRESPSRKLCPSA